MQLLTCLARGPTGVHQEDAANAFAREESVGAGRRQHERGDQGAAHRTFVCNGGGGGGKGSPPTPSTLPFPFTQAERYLLPTTYYLLPTTHYLLLTTHYLPLTTLLTTYYTT